MDPLHVLTRTGLRSNLPLVHFQVVNSLVTGKKSCYSLPGSRAGGPSRFHPCWVQQVRPLSMFYPSVSLNCVYPLFLPILQLQTVPKIAFLQAFGVLVIPVVTLPSQGGPKDKGGSQVGCVTDTRQKVWPSLRFLTTTSFDSVTHHWDGELAAVCVGQP